MQPQPSPSPDPQPSAPANGVSATPLTVLPQRMAVQQAPDEPDDASHQPADAPRESGSSESQVGATPPQATDSTKQPTPVHPRTLPLSLILCTGSAMIALATLAIIIYVTS